MIMNTNVALLLCDPDEFVLRQVLTYPICYAGSKYEYCKFAVFDSLFNVIGNGISMEDLRVSNVILTEEDRIKALQFCECSTVFFTTEKNYLDVYCIEENKTMYPDVHNWKIHKTLTDYPAPYPNFTRQYSLVWKPDPFGNGVSFVDGCNKKWLEA